jgi:hypothetical protein
MSKKKAKAAKLSEKNKLFIVHAERKGSHAHVVLAAPNHQAAIERLKKMKDFDGCIFQSAAGFHSVLLKDRYTFRFVGGKTAVIKWVADKNPHSGNPKNVNRQRLGNAASPKRRASRQDRQIPAGVVGGKR